MSSLLLVGLLGLVCGAVLGWLLHARTAAQESALRESDLRAQHEALKQQYEARLQEAVLSTERLRTQLEALLPQVAETVLGAKTEQLEKTAAGDRANLQTMLGDMAKRLAEYQERITGFEKERSVSQGRIQQQVESLAQVGAQMAQETQTLRAALATSGGVRGRWGEAVLKNILDSCGLNAEIDYFLQVQDGGGRPDAIVRLPSGRRLAIDAKANLNQFLDGLQADSDGRRRECFQEFAKVLRRTAKELSQRNYDVEDGLPCTLMFVASEGAFRAALDADPGLFQYGQDLRPSILLASPSTLFPLIAVIAEAWQQHRAGERMSELLEEVKIFGDRLGNFLEHIQRVGKSLDAAGKAYSAALSSYQSRLAPRVERIREMGAGWNDIEELKPLEHRLTLPAGVQDE